MYGPFTSNDPWAFASGCILYLLFHKFESPTGMFRLYACALVAPVLPILREKPTDSMANTALRAYTISYTVLISLTVIYRVSPFHPLAKFPGPLIPKITNFWSLYQTHTGKHHEVMLRLHRKYGSVVRVGPNDISVCDESYLKGIIGGDGMPKGPIWDGRRDTRNPYTSLVALRDTTQHLKRRRIWNKAFNASAVKRYEPALVARLHQFVEILIERSKNGSEILDMAHWISLFSYDFMGDMVFGGAFDLMKDGDVDGVWSIMELGIRSQSYTQHIPWISALIYSWISGLVFVRSTYKLIWFVVKISQARISRGPSGPGSDLSYYLLDEGGNPPNPPNIREFMSEAYLAIVAGSDTSATVMSSTIYNLIANPHVFSQLRQEIDREFPLTGTVAPKDRLSSLGELPMLNAVINETMRLAPPVTVSIQRAPAEGSKGKLLGNLFIPEGTGVYVPPYVLRRDPRYFSPDPEVFRPDRWLEESCNEFITEENAFIPFSLGPMNCVGKPLAQVELRLVIATLIREFDMEFAKGWDPAAWEKDLEDYFVLKKGKLPVILTRRT